MIINKSEEDKRKDIVENISNSVFVEAGAGAGKTTLIIKRVENLLKSGVSPENIVVITFTNKATEVLISRLNDKIMTLIGDENLTDAERQNLENARQHISRMQVSTIHGFCSRLLSENALGVGLPIEQSIIDEGQSESEQMVLFESYFKKGMDYGDFDALLTTYDSYYDMKNKLYELYSQFLKVCNKDVALPNENDAIPKMKDYSTKAKKCFDDLQEVINKEVSERFECADICADENRCNFLKDFREAYETVLKGKEMLAGIKKVYELTDAGKVVKTKGVTIKAKTIKDGTGKKKSQTVLLGEVNAGIKKSKAFNEIKTLLDDVSKVQKILLQKSLRAALINYYESRNSSLLTNDLLLEKTRDLLRDNPDHVKELAVKFKHIFVDEFQDVDHFQAQMALSFHRAGSILFIVGDPKQSIYRFRGAEPVIFDEVKKLFTNSKSDQVFVLNNNYRSAKPVLDWVNDNYSKIFVNKYNNMIVGKRPYEGTISSTTLQGVYVEPDYTGEKSDAERVSDIVKKLIDEKYTILDTRLVDGEEVYEERPIRPKDFLVLAWDTTNFPELVKCFRTEQIPCILSGNLPLGVYCVLERYMYLYRHLAGAGDYKLTLEGAIEAVLHSDCEKQEEREKAEIILNAWSKETHKLNGMQLAGFLLGKLHYMLPRDDEKMVISRDEMISSLGKIHQMIETITIAEGTADPKCFYDCIRNYFSGKLNYEIEFGDGADDAVRVMNIDKAKGLEGKIVILMYRGVMNDKDNAYYIKTIKTDDANNPLDIMDWKYEYYYSDILTSSESTLETTENSEEIKRKQYVIVTRAEEALIILSKPSDKEKDYLKELCFDASEEKTLSNYLEEEFFEKAVSMNDGDEDDTLKDVKTTEITPEDGVSVVDETSADDVRLFDEKKDLSPVPEELKRNILVSVTPSGLEHEEKKTKADDVVDENIFQGSEEESATEAMQADESEDQDEDRDETLEKRPSGNIFGTVMHRSFEMFINYIREKADVSDDDISECIRIAISESMRDIKQRYRDNYKEKCCEFKDYLTKVLCRFVAEKNIKELLGRTEQFYTEYDFSFWTSIAELGDDYDVLKPYLEKKKIQVSDDQRIYINGVADLMLLTDDGCLHIIDYKSDTKVRKADGKYKTLADEEFNEHLKKYDGQLTLYRIAMSKVFGIPQDKISTVLYDMYNGTERK